MSILVCLLVASLHSSASPVSAIDEDRWLETAKDTLETAKQMLEVADSGAPDTDELAAVKQAVVPIRVRAQSCITEVEEALKKRRNDVELLGPKLSQEEPSVARTRADLVRERDALQKRLVACRTISILAKDIKDASDAIEQASLARRLRVRGPSLRAIAQQSLDQTTAWWAVDPDFLMAWSGLQGLTAIEWLMMFGVILLGFGGGRALGRSLAKREHLACVDKCTSFLLALRTCGARSVPMIGALGSVAGYLSVVLPYQPMPFITQAAWGLPAFIVLIAVVNTVFCPAPPAKP